MDRLSYEAKVPIFQRMRYLPNADQVPIHQDLNGISLTSGGWRSGKSVVIAAEATPHLLIPSPRPYLGALIGPTYKEPREEFDYIATWLAAMLPKSQFDPDKHMSRPKDGPAELTIPAIRGEDGLTYFGTVRTYTAAEAEAVRAFNADFVIMCEAGGISEDSFLSIIGRVLSTGGFILGSGTLETSQKWYMNVIKEGLSGPSKRGISSHVLPSWANTKVFPGGRQDPKILRAELLFPDELFRVRIGGEPVRMTGVAVGSAKLEHVQQAKFRSDLPVELAVDPGYTGAYSVLALQYYDNTVYVVDEIYERFKSTVDVARITMARPWFQNVSPGMPGVIDRAAKQHSSTDGYSVLERWQEETGLWLDLTEAVIPVPVLLDQLNIHFHSGGIVVDPQVRGMLGELDLGAFPDGMERYEPWQYRRDPEGRLIGDKALKGADHSLSALGYWLIHRYGFITPETLDYGPAPNDQWIPQTEDYGPSGGGLGEREVVGWRD